MGHYAMDGNEVEHFLYLAGALAMYAVFTYCFIQTMVTVDGHCLLGLSDQDIVMQTILCTVYASVAALDMISGSHVLSNTSAYFLLFLSV